MSEPLSLQTQNSCGSTSYYFGMGVFGGAYGAVMIALGVALIAKKEAVT
jgi:hypothetical protein